MGRSAANSSGANTVNYDVIKAGEAYKERRLKCRRKKKLAEGSELYRHVRKQLVEQRWSPQQIASSLKQMPDTERLGSISHETIYAQPRGALKKK